MKEQIYKLSVPDKYEENLIEFIDGMDNIPELPELLLHGFTIREVSKINKLIFIEKMKYLLRTDINDGILSDKEQQEAQDIIQQSIMEYNKM